MGVILYQEKMFVRSEKMTYTNEHAILSAKINYFLAIFHAPVRIKSSNGCKTVVNNTYFIHSTADHKSINSAVATAALQKLMKHP